MGLLSDLFDRARTLLTRGKPAGTATDAIVQGSFEDLVYEGVEAEVPALAQMAEELSDHYAAADELVRDTWSVFYQHSPQLRDKTEMASSRLHNWAAAKGLLDSPSTAETQQWTTHDKYGSVMATLGAGPVLREHLEKHKELEEKAEQEAQAEDELESALAGLQQAAAAASTAEDGDDEAGAAADLAAAVEAAEQAQTAAQAAHDATQQAAERARIQMQGALAQAAERVAEQLAEEQELFQAWGVADGEVQHWSFAERQAMVQMLKRSEVSRYLKLLGRFKFTERALRAKRTDHGRDEMYAIERGDRLEDVLTSELAMLGNAHLRREFLSRFSEGQLLVRAYRGLEESGKGAVICCVDTSDSMNWTHAGYKPAAWSKAFALALLERAKADGRDFVGIIFSSRNQVQTFRFPKGKGKIEEIVAFVTRAFNGGTNFEAPLNAAADLLEAEFNDAGRRRGDIVFITDDNCAVGDEWLTNYRRRKEQLGFRTWGIACGKARPGAPLVAISDNVRAISEFLDPTPVADLLKSI